MMQRLFKGIGERGFALPTVLIVSIVMLTVLAVSVTATAAVRSSLRDQYYAQLAQITGEAGVEYAKACLAANGNVPQWSDAQPLRPNTDCSGNTTLATTVKVVVVGGGGGGGAFGGGGGAGGYVYDQAYAVTPQSYTVTVGAGGAGGTGTDAGNNGANGSNSVFGTLTAYGGGGGGSRASGGVGKAGSAGASGGGASPADSSPKTGGAASPAGQGNKGGDVTALGANLYGAGGGGGAGAPGVNGYQHAGGNGGNGVPNPIVGSTVGQLSGGIYYLAGGGGGGSWRGVAGTVGAGGLGGGGAGTNASANGVAGTANTGGGGGGSDIQYAGGAGGSGVVIVSYPTGSLVATGGTITYTDTMTIHTYTSGTSSFVVSSVRAGYSCYSSGSDCYVMVNGNVRSSFRVGMPTLDSEGKAVTIPNTGYVEIIRSSNGSVWRTYTQPSVQAAVVPGLCSGLATSAQGWNNAVARSSSTNISGATPISLSTGDVYPGPVYYRKDFSVTEAGVYTLQAYLDGGGQVYVDDTPIAAASSPGTVTGSTSLTQGCHSITVKLINEGIASNSAILVAALTKSGSASPVVVTDTSWRYSAGNVVSFASTGYYVDPTRWAAARDINAASSIFAQWAAAGGDATARWIGSAHSYDGSGNYPDSQWTYYRDSRDVTVASPTAVRVLLGCDDFCELYLDGQLIGKATWSAVSNITVNIGEGSHRFGIAHYNGSSGAGVVMTVQRISDSVRLTQTDGSWLAAHFWESANNHYYSYDNAYSPNPSPILGTTVRLLVVGGGGGGAGGGGGGGGAGGYVSIDAYPIDIRSYSVVVGAGGTSSAANTSGTKGQNSLFGSIVAEGGGGGTTYGGGHGGGGGSGGGAAIMTSGSPPQGGAASQGYSGGIGMVNAGWTGGGAGGGGAGGVGGNAGNTAGVANGGVGVSNSITGTALMYAAGGGGGEVNGSFAGTGGSGIGGSATVNGTGTAGAANTGSGGGAGAYTGSLLAGGAGGSGVVIIAYPTGSITAAGGTITTAGGFTIHRFTSSGTFVVTAIAPKQTRDTNIAPSLSTWTLSGGASYNSGSGELTIPAAGSAVSPLIKVDKPASIVLGGDFYAPGVSAHHTPGGGNHIRATYYQSDGVTSANNSSGAGTQDCTQSLTISAWVTNDLRCVMLGGQNVVYVRYSIYGSSGGYSSANLVVKNPQVVLAN